MTGVRHSPRISRKTACAAKSLSNSVYVPVQTRPLAEANRPLNDLRQGQIVSRAVLTP